MSVNNHKAARKKKKIIFPKKAKPNTFHYLLSIINVQGICEHCMWPIHMQDNGVNPNWLKNHYCIRGSHQVNVLNYDILRSHLLLD